jgi:hypothetical protein
MLLNDLFESVSSVVYHYTSLPNAATILSGNSFRLTTSAGTGAEQSLAKGNKPYYLSTTRSKVGDYTLHQFYKSGVVFELNGDWFNQRYKGAPVDYWGRNRSQGAGLKGRYKEMEDRVFSDEAYIPFPKNPKDLIRSIHILWKEDDDKRFNQYLRTVLIRAKQLGIPYYAYDDEAAFVLQDTRKAVAIDIKSLINPEIKKFGDNWPQSKKDYFKGWRELYYAKDSNSLSKEGKRLFNMVTRYLRDANSSLSADIHNAKSTADPGLIKLLQIFKSMGITTPLQYVDKMHEKWDAINAIESEKYFAAVKKKREQEELDLKN